MSDPKAFNEERIAIEGPDGKFRCRWPGTDPLYLAYHDTEWGVPEYDSRALWEKLILDGFQAGLSWITILRKRDAFRDCFEGFDPARVARWGEPEIARALQNPGIVRHRGKIAAVINNARRAQELIKREGSLAAYLWRFEPATADLPPPQTVTTLPAAIALSKDLKKRGWSFVGPTTVYAFMQAMGLVNDHAEDCAIRAEVAAARAAFTPPVSTPVA